jgi:hypothetical protein
MAQQLINLGVAPNDRTGDTPRSGGKKINDNFTELYARVSALETTSISAAGQISAIQAVDATQGLSIAQIQIDLAAEAAARSASDLQEFIPTTDGIQLVEAKNYTVGFGHTVIFPLLAENRWIRLEPANGDWYSVNAIFDSVYPIESITGSEPNAALLFIRRGNQIKVRQ